MLGAERWCALRARRLFFTGADAQRPRRTTATLALQAPAGPPALVRRDAQRASAEGCRALSALDRAPRRRQAGAGEHAGGLPRRRLALATAPSSSTCCSRRRRAVPAARRHLDAPPRHAASRRAQLAELAPRRRRLAQPRLRRRAVAQPGGDRRLLRCATASRSTSRSSPRRARSARPDAWSRARRRGCGHEPRRAGGAAALSSFRPEALPRRARRRPSCRALLLDTLWTGWFDVARALDVVACVTNHKIMDEELHRAVAATGLRALVYTVNDARGATPADARHRQDHHRRGGSGSRRATHFATE